MTWHKSHATYMAWILSLKRSLRVTASAANFLDISKLTKSAPTWFHQRVFQQPSDLHWSRTCNQHMPQQDIPEIGFIVKEANFLDRSIAGFVCVQFLRYCAFGLMQFFKESGRNGQEITAGKLENFSNITERGTCESDTRTYSRYPWQSSYIHIVCSNWKSSARKEHRDPQRQHNPSCEQPCTYSINQIPRARERTNRGFGQRKVR